MFIRQLSIIGVGLIGGSLARALKQGGKCGEVVGYGRTLGNLQKAVELGVIDRFSTDIGAAVQGSDMVVVAVPLGGMAGVFQSIRDSLGEDAIITDVGSAKASVVGAARTCLGAALPRFVPAHPLAGAEKTGVTASTADLFVKRRVVITPIAETSASAKAKVSEMWKLTGAEVVEMPVAQHDRILAATSHLPHMLAYTLVDLLADMETRHPTFGFAASGFRDFSRIASSDPAMWRDICLANREALLDILQQYQARLHSVSEAIRQGDAKALEELFQRAKVARDQFYL